MPSSRKALQTDSGRKGNIKEYAVCAGKNRSNEEARSISCHLSIRRSPGIVKEKTMKTVLSLTVMIALALPVCPASAAGYGEWNDYEAYDRNGDGWFEEDSDGFYDDDFSNGEDEFYEENGYADEDYFDTYTYDYD